MQSRDLLKKIRKEWLANTTRQLGRNEWGKDYSHGELNRFFDLVIQSLETNNPEWLRPLLLDWASSKTEEELSAETIVISPIIKLIFSELITTGRENLTSDEAMELCLSLFPLMAYSFEQVSQQEANVQIEILNENLNNISTELERLDRSKSDFIAVAAHELKTPLTLVEGYASMLREQFPDEDPEAYPLTLLKGVDSGVIRLGSIIDDMIDVSMIDNQLFSLKFQPTWINRLLKGVEQELSFHINERNQKLIIRDFPGGGDMIFADSERLQQCFKNILSNAIKYTPDGGIITVSGRILSGFIEVIVTDTGIGIDVEDQTMIFRKFGQLGDVALHSSGGTKYKGGGPGLGLSIAKGIIEAHGGTIWAESPGFNEESPPGSTFHILIPMRDQPPDKEIARIFNSVSEEEHSE